MQPTNNEGADAPVGAPGARLTFLRPRVFVVCTAAWLAFACFLWMRDFLMLGSSARALTSSEVFLTIQSMVMWGLFSPFILTAAELLEFDTGKRLRAFALHVVCALVLSAFDVALDLSLIHI